MAASGPDAVLVGRVGQFWEWTEDEGLDLSTEPMVGWLTKGDRTIEINLAAT